MVWIRCIVLYRTALCSFRNCFPLSVLLITSIWDEMGHMGCYLWTGGLSVAIEEPRTQLLVVSLLSCSWIFRLIDLF